MRKNDMIAMLQGIKGNPEICMWNGYVGDWMAIDKEPVELELVKQSREFVRDGINHSRIRNNLAPISEEELDIIMKETYNEWELPNEFVQESEMERWYGKRRKKIIVLNSKKRGKSTWDRSGTMEY